MKRIQILQLGQQLLELYHLTQPWQLIQHFYIQKCYIKLQILIISQQNLDLQNSIQIKINMKYQLEGIEYVPLLDYFLDRKQQGCFKVLLANFVTDKDGTGIVHIEPGFGEDDFKLSLKAGIITNQDPQVLIDSDSKSLDSVKDFQGMDIKSADKEIRRNLKIKGRLIKDGQIQLNHAYCWRSQTPLIYKAVSCWFIKVTAIKNQLIANNYKARWVPYAIQEGRFNNCLQNAQDWYFSRNRFWGNPIPIWASENFEELDQITLLQTEGKILLKVLVNTKKSTSEQNQIQSKLQNKQEERSQGQEIQCELLLKHVKITEQFNTKKHQNLLFTKEDGYSLIIDPSQTQQLKNLGLAREFTNNYLF